MTPSIPSEEFLPHAFSGFSDQLGIALAALGDEIATAPSDEELVRRQPVTRFILTWMGEQFRMARELSGLINRQTSSSAADDFTLVVGVTLKTYLEARGVTATVRSEAPIVRGRGAMHPDISVWNDAGEMAAFIECKTNFGWNRSGWVDQYHDRTERACAVFPQTDSYLCVLSAANWDSRVMESSDLAGKRWLCLARPWPTALHPPFDGQVVHPIEPMFLSIRGAALLA